VWNGFIWVEIKTTGRFLATCYWKFWFYKVWRISWAPAAAAQQVPSKEGLLMDLARQGIRLFSLRQRHHSWSRWNWTCNVSATFWQSWGNWSSVFWHRCFSYCDSMTEGTGV
jgi:hypothetical protein